MENLTLLQVIIQVLVLVCSFMAVVLGYVVLTTKKSSEFNRGAIIAPGTPRL